MAASSLTSQLLSVTLSMSIHNSIFIYTSTKIYYEYKFAKQHDQNSYANLRVIFDCQSLLWVCSVQRHQTELVEHAWLWSRQVGSQLVA